MEIEKNIQSGGHNLQGTLSLPDGTEQQSGTSASTNSPAQAVVLFLAGSGELDRNCNGPRMQLNIFNSLAEQFAEEGVASYRYDKRGCGSSGGVYNETGFYELLEDTKGCLTALDKFEETREAPVFLLGHSEGTLLASLLSAKHKEVQGQVLLNPFLEPLEKTIERQLDRTLEEIKGIAGFKGYFIRFFLKISGDQKKKQKRIMDRVRNTNQATIKVKKTIINAKWLRDHLQVDPKEIHSSVTTPTLSIGGGKDVQCRTEDAQTIVDIMPASVDVQIFDDLTHIVRADDQPASTFRYRELAGLPVDNRVVEASLDWIKSQLTNAA